MPTDIRLIRSQDFLCVTPQGNPDFETSKEALLLVASAASKLENYEILLDTRKSHVQMSATDLWYLAVELGKRREAFSRKTAVLCPVEEFDNAAFFALCSENLGLRVRAFTSFEDAIHWLVGSDAW